MQQIVSKAFVVSSKIFIKALLKSFNWKKRRNLLGFAALLYTAK